MIVVQSGLTVIKTFEYDFRTMYSYSKMNQSEQGIYLNFFDTVF
jgi:hypothetical protein